jgi:uncharacterized protein DUF4349
MSRALLACLAVVLLAGCVRPRRGVGYVHPETGMDATILPRGATDAPAHQETPKPEAATDLAAPKTDAAPTPSAPTVSDPRKIVYNAQLTVQVPDVAAAEQETRKMLTEASGWLHASDGSTITMRIPAALFQPTVDRLAALGRVVNKKVAALDVTEEFLDVDLRLRNAQALRDRLAALLEKAQNVAEAIEVERELARVTQEIERLKGRQRAMADQIEHSTIVVTFVLGRERAPALNVAFPFPWVRELGLRSLQEFSK